MQYVYSTVYAAAGGRGRESIYNDNRSFENRLLSKKCMKLSNAWHPGCAGNVPRMLVIERKLFS